MFGGHGLYLDGEFFGMVFDGRAWFRTDDRTRPRYREAGALPVPFGGPGGEKRYWSVPEDVLEDGPLLVEWAREAAAVPRGASRKGAARKQRPQPVRARSRSSRPPPGAQGGPTMDSRVTGGRDSKGAVRTAQSDSGQRAQ